MRSVQWRRARQRSISMDCESVECVANAFSKVPFQPTFFLHRWQVARCYNVTYQALVTIGPSCRRRNLRSVIGPYAGRIEFVVDADAQEIVGDPGIEGHRGRRPRRWRWNGRDHPQIEVEVLDLGGPIAGQTAFDAAADRPAPFRVVAADDR